MFALLKLPRTLFKEIQYSIQFKICQGNVNLRCQLLFTGLIFIWVQFDKRSLVFQTIISCSTSPGAYFIDSVIKKFLEPAMFCHLALWRGNKGKVKDPRYMQNKKDFSLFCDTYSFQFLVGDFNLDFFFGCRNLKGA